MDIEHPSSSNAFNKGEEEEEEEGKYHTKRHYGHIQAYQNLGNIQLLSRRHERLEEERGAGGMQTRGESEASLFLPALSLQLGVKNDNKGKRRRCQRRPQPRQLAPRSPADASRTTKSNECWRREID